MYALLLVFIHTQFLQVGEFFHSARSSAEAQQPEYGSNQSGEESLEAPLLPELVILS